jgi:hydrogenase maturation protease
MTCPQLLVIGIGNPDRGDDGFGPAVARALAERAPAGLACVEHDGEPTGLMDCWAGAARVVLIDAVRSGRPPGHIVRLDLAREPLAADIAPRSTHALGLAQAVELARVLGRLPPWIRFIGAEGTAFEPGTDLSPALLSARDAVVAEIVALMTRGET